MFKVGQIWDRTHLSGQQQIGVLLVEESGSYKTFIISGRDSGNYNYWSVRAMEIALHEHRMVQLA